MKVGKVVMVMVLVEIGIILVVVLCNECFNYSCQDDLIINIGNVFFCVIVYGVCKDFVQDQGWGCWECYYVMSGIKIRF